ncbi:hypothetical protein, partial [Schlesneria sp.]|uniref:hypothetical protein n=1 Tax=Schlesneria sp. TaxID=2762018 RepID=UPI002F097DD1
SWGFGGYAGRIVYYPFNDSFTGAPVKSAGATRKYKLHLIFTDDMSPPNNGKTQIRFVKTDNGGEYVRFHDISRTWGEVADRSRDESTDPVLASEYSGYARHVRVEIRTTHPQGYGRLFYLALQTWDVY